MPTPEEDAALAHSLFLQGDLRHGAFHLACALAGEPANGDWLALADRYVEMADDPLALVPLGDGETGSYFAMGALRSYVLHKLGRTADSLNLLLQVNASRPGAPFLSWTVAWLDERPEIGALIDRKLLSHFLKTLLHQYPGELIDDDPAACEALRPVLRLTELTVGDPDPLPMLTFVRVALLRKTGQLDEALDLGRRAYEAMPCYELASAVAQVHHARDDEEPWREWQIRALEHQPSEISTRKDLGDHYFLKRNLVEAERWYREVLEIEPGEPWAHPSYLAVRAHQGDRQAEKELHAFAEAHPDNERATQLSAPGATPWVEYLPPPQEALVNMLSRLRQKDPGEAPLVGGEIKINLSGLEAPSARLALETGMANLGMQATMRYNVTVQQPDPRLPRRKVRFQVWRYPEERQWLVRKKISTDPVPAVPRPPEELARAIGEIARSPYDRARWMDQARSVVARLRPTAEQILGVMAFPPPTPEGRPAPDWIYRSDVAAAMVLANVDEAPWAGSLRREALFDLALGTMDWSIDAAVIALATLAEAQPEIVPEVSDILLSLLENQPGTGYVCYEAPVVYCLQRFPGLSEELQSSLAALRRRLEEDEAPPDQG